MQHVSPYVCAAWPLAALCNVLVLAPASAEPAAIRIPHVSRPPRLEDYTTAATREAEVVVSDFRQREPGDGVPASEQTTAYLSYDDSNLYVVFVCSDSAPSKLRAHLGRREAIFDDDAVGVMLDTFRDRQHAYFLAANAFGVQLDGIITEGQEDDYSFDTVWRSEGRVTPDGFIVWFAIPFKSLRFTNAPDQTWGIALMRSTPRNNEISFWPYITRRIDGFTNQMATVEGLQHLSPGRNVQFIPYAAFQTARFLDEQAAAYTATREPRAGLNSKIVLRDALTLDLSLNPDFSQVESDEPQVTVNQRFEVFFPEKRPFFIENAGYFRTPETLFFSRRVADPQFGARLTGKMGRWAVGALAIDDRAADGELLADDVHRGDRAGLGVLRIQRELPGQSTIGMIAVGRNFGGGFNRVAAVDARVKLNRNWVLTGQSIISSTREFDGATRAGPAYSAELTRAGRKFFYDAVYNDRSPGFGAHLGFVPRTDIRQLTQFMFYRWRPSRGPLVAFGPNSFALLNWNRRGQLQDWEVRFPFDVNLKGQTQIFIRRVEKYELFDGLGFREHYNTITFSSNWFKAVGGSLSAEWGARPNYYPAAGLEPFPGDFLDASIGLRLQPTSSLRADLSYIHDHLRTGAGAAIFDDHLLRAKINHQFTREWSLRTIIDYNADLANPSLVALERDKRFTADVLLTRLINPWTALYVGFTDRHANLDVDPTRPATLRRLIDPTASTGRQVFVKTSYLLRF
jgi:hypothetical protein